MNEIAQKPFAAGRSRPVEASIVKAVERSPLRDHPCDHIYMEDVFDRETYETLLAEMPDRRFYHELQHRDALLPDGHSTRFRLYLYPELLGQLPENQRRLWQSVARALCSPELEAAFKRKFRDALESRFKTPIEKLSLYPVPILLRDQPGYRIGIHADKLTKAITVQFYLPRDASQKHIGTIFHESNTGEGAQRTTQMPFMPSSGYAFPVTAQKSWHSAARTTEEDGERITMMVTYYATLSARQRLWWRLRRALMSIGIHPKK